MSKRGDPTRLHGTKVKKRRGVGSRTIAILNSDDDDPPPMVAEEYARTTKTRVGAFGKVERVSMSSIPIFEQPSTPPPLEEDVVDDFADVTFEHVPAMPAKRTKRVNDSVSGSDHTDLFDLLTTL